MGALSKEVKIKYTVDERNALRGHRALEKANERTRSRVASTAKAMAGLAVGAAAAAATAAAGFVRLAESSAETANQIAKTSRGLGVAADEMQRLHFAVSRETTLSVEQFNKSISALTVGLEDAAQRGTGPAARALETLGLTVRQLDGLGVERQIGQIADAIGRLPNEQQRAAVSAQLFGMRNGPQMQALLAKGAEGIEALGDEAERMGLVLDREALASSEAFVDSMADMRSVVKAVARDIGIAAAPAIKDAADKAKEWVIQNRALIDQELPELMETIAGAMTEVVNTGAEAVSTFNKMAKAAEGLGEKLGPVGEKLLDIAKFNAKGGFAGALVRGTVANEARGGLGAALRSNPVRAGIENPLNFTDLTSGLNKEIRRLTQQVSGQRKINEDKPSGGRRDPFKDERVKFQRQLAEARNAERLREFSEANSLQRNYLRDVQRAQQELAAAQQPEIDRLKLANEALQRKSQLEVASMERSIELARAQGDPAAAFAMEQEQFAVREQALRRQLELETQVGEREAVEDQLAQVRHERTVSRIQEEQRRREALALTVQNTIAAVSHAEQGAFQLSSTIAGATIKGEERKKRALDGIKAAGLFADGAVASAKAVIAYASGNIPQGVALTAAAANAFAQGAVVAAGNAGSGGAGGGAGGSASATQFSRGEAPQQQVFRVDRGAPLSVRDDVEGNPNNTGGSTGSLDRGTTVNIGEIKVAGAVDDETIRQIKQGIARAEGNLGI